MNPKMKKVLILGAGLVAGPIIKFLLNNGFYVTVASNTPNRAEELINNAPRGYAISWDAKDQSTLDSLIKEHDITVSLLPYTLHVGVAEKCIVHKKNMVTTSYVSPEMQALDAEAKNADIIILNECGLDPGIDHMSAKRIIDTVHGFGGKILEFYSLCGALPAPEISNENPFRYKFSWSPKGVILAGNNDANYMKNGKEKLTSAENLFKDVFNYSIKGIEDLEVYPNRNSLPYINLYNIPETKTMFRGTIRYKGWCEIIDTLKALKLISQDEHDFTGMTYAQMLAKTMNLPNTANLTQKTAKFLKVYEGNTAIKAMEFLGLFEDIQMNRTKDSTYEIVSDLMIKKMMLGKDERDMTILEHIILAKYPDGKQEVITSKLLDFGEPGGDTSIARTVALPAACAVKMILEDEILVRGVHIPILPDIYNPIMHELENMGIELVEEYGLPLSRKIQD
jgi:saccharopine dehydrogenase-like NADP-dependent oxidoreductase